MEEIEKKIYITLTIDGDFHISKKIILLLIECFTIKEIKRIIIKYVKKN